MKLLVSTRNKHKLEEIRAIFNMRSLDLVDVNYLVNPPEVIENGKTFQANAIKKAVTLAMASGLWTIADDSGLEVDTLRGRPGIHSARYAGEPVDYKANNRKLLAELTGFNNRVARFYCVIALSSPAGRTQIVEGECEGVITNDERGDSGFGYDPVFLPDGYDQTFGEMDRELKNNISHRAAALNAAKEIWFSEEPYGF